MAYTALPLLLVAAWLFLFAGVRLVASDFLLRERHEPFLPYVAAPFEYGGDVVSIVPHLFRALVVVSVCVIVVEVAKILAVASGAGWLWLVALAAYQAALVLEGMRALAPDWTTYGLYFIGLTQRDASTYDFSRVVVPYAAPWFSFVVLSVVVVLWLRRTPAGSAGALDNTSMRTTA